METEANVLHFAVDYIWNVMAHVQKPDFVFRRNGRVHLNRWGFQFSRLLAAEVCASAVLMLDTPCSEVVWRVLATHSICHFPTHASPCAFTFQLDSKDFFMTFLNFRFMICLPLTQQFSLFTARAIKSNRPGSADIWTMITQTVLGLVGAELQVATKCI
jgi:hypothetical protein